MWAALANVLVGVWLMAAPAVLAYGPPMATSDRVAGPFIAAFAGVAVGECTRGVRFWVWPFSAWLLVAPIALDATPAAAINSVACGIVSAFLASIRGRVSTPFGGGWGVLIRGDRGAQDAARAGTET